MTFAQTLIDARRNLRRRAQLELGAEIVISGMMGISTLLLLAAFAVMMGIPLAVAYAMRAW